MYLVLVIICQPRHGYYSEIFHIIHVFNGKLLGKIRNFKSSVIIVMVKIYDLTVFEHIYLVMLNTRKSVPQVKVAQSLPSKLEVDRKLSLSIVVSMLANGSHQPTVNGSSEKSPLANLLATKTILNSLSNQFSTQMDMHTLGPAAECGEKTELIIKDQTAWVSISTGKDLFQSRKRCVRNIILFSKKSV